MLEAYEGVVHIPGHIHMDASFLGIPVKGESDIFFAFPIFLSFIVLFEYTYEVFCMFLCLHTLLQNYLPEV